MGGVKVALLYCLRAIYLVYPENLTPNSSLARQNGSFARVAPTRSHHPDRLVPSCNTAYLWTMVMLVNLTCSSFCFFSSSLPEDW